MSSPESGVPRLPNFVVIGAPKCGTTSLHRYLASHPDVFMSEVKELDFFIADRNWALGVDWYRRQFAQAGAVKAVGESSPRYTQHPDHRGVAERAAELIPEARLVYLLRNPLDQMVSHYRDRVRWRSERAPMVEALRENPIYLETARYASQIERFLVHFPRQQILVVTAERLRAPETRADTLVQVLRFLDVDVTWASEDWTQEHNVALPMRRSLVQRLSTTRAWDPAVSVLPDSVKRRTRALTHRAARRVELPDALLRSLTSELADEIGKLRRLVDGEIDGWGIA